MTEVYKDIVAALVRGISPNDELYQFTLGSKSYSAIKIWAATVEHAVIPHLFAKFLLQQLLPPDQLEKTVKDYLAHYQSNEEQMPILQDSKNQTTFITIAEYFMTNLLIPFRNKGRNLAMPEMAIKAMTLKSQAKRNENFKKDLLTRDCDKCVASGRWHRAKNPYEERDHPVRLQGAHIIPFSISNQPARVHSAIRVFSGYTIPKDFVKDIDTPSNGLLLQIDAHQDFDEYLWGLEADGEQNYSHGYRVKPIVTVHHLGLSFEPLPVIKFQGEKVPNPAFLKLHLAIGTVLWKVFSVDLLEEYCDDDEEPWEELEKWFA